MKNPTLTEIRQMKSETEEKIKTFIQMEVNAFQKKTQTRIDGVTIGIMNLETIGEFDRCYIEYVTLEMSI